MPIVALPPTTVRAIGSTSIISDPYSVVKELLDNSLDAAATSVSIEISLNTVDTIQIKDNGHGIPASDYGLVCKRTFTSKIHTVEDLRKVGGKSLGFRGEALASAAEVSGTLVISTRVQSEPVGSFLRYGRNGELLSSENVAHPVGTTVKVSNLFRQIPVRRQTAVKNSKKTLLRIRKMIQAYAMARPSTRLSLKIIKAKNDSGNWMYAPGKESTLIDAALKVAGRDVASSCITKEWPGSHSNNCESSRDVDPDIKLAALLPNLGSDFTRFNNMGQYVSIDGRPISPGRGVAQSIVKLYRSYLHSAASRGGLSPTITDPFLCVHVLCPDGTYDVNIEPLKDDVLFENQPAILSLFESLLQDVYGVEPDANRLEPDNLAENREPVSEDRFEVALSERSQETTLVNPPVSHSQNEDIVSARTFMRPGPPRRSPQGSRHSLGNPLALSTKTRTSDTSSVVNTQRHHRSFSHRGTEPSPSNSSPREIRQTTDLGALPSPVSSSGSPPSHTASLSPTTPVRNPREQQRERDRERYGNGSLDTWFLKLSQASQTTATTGDTQTHDTEPSLSQLTQHRFGSGVASPSNAPEIHVGSSQQINTSSSPTPESESVQVCPNNAAQASRGVNKGKGLPVLEQWAARLYNTPNPDENPELQKALEFETRKKAAIQERRLQIQGSRPSAPTSSPHQSRYLAARAALNSEPDSTMQQSKPVGAANTNGAYKSVLNPHDPRAYLIRLQNTDALSNSKLKRIKSNKLPFEKIPEGHDLHSLGCTSPANLSLLHTSFNETAKVDLYTRSGDQTDAFNPRDLDAAIESWSYRLSKLMETYYRPTEDSDIPLPQFDFSSIIRTSNNNGLPVANA
ncbi:hypothetical protein ASPVEDRAFT_24834 [Aspergillus versicolor CBS 583.65]|uniref:DNA mismatch repair protein S5 domain-containing protein n=1 Tax=Aspergillus versicolor CBS 583.65 TaxID=1036611 RepID=A0A1L9P8U7_ASPVE|nr:uncharacterized protein ASPVEDRAFT_24834 [Aspergillus versicolor CBS 583.65]OJI97918.1 hypothetical protein ASPVEDRAFT_24834 [Aspergillus versicolor CBS 583.65]